jgi:DNA-binding CsgD family transcriptional regulator
MFLARMEVASGDWDAAVRCCDDGIELARQAGRESNEWLCRMVRAEVGAYRGDVQRARSEIPRLLRVAADVGYRGAVHRLTRALASLELSCGDAVAAWRLSAPLFAGVGELDEVLAQVAGSVAVEALVDTGDVVEADRLLALLDERAAESDTALQPLAARCRGLLLAAAGRHEPAIAMLETAVVEPEPPQGANPLELARTLLALGTVQRRAQRKRDARETLQAAAARFGQLGARTWEARADAELHRIGGRTSSKSELSETERQIVELVVAGHRNREVAAELSLSPNTVAWNLSKIYRKLGVRSRTELAARVASNGPE